MNKNEFDIIDKQLKSDFGEQTEEYKVLGQFFLSNKINKYLKLLSLLNKSSIDDLDNESLLRPANQGRFSVRSFQTQFSKQKFVNQMAKLEHKKAQQERSILFDMLESILKAENYMKAYKLLQKHKYHLDYNGQHLADIFCDFLLKSSDLDSQIKKYKHKVSYFQYQLEVKTLALQHKLQEKDKIIFDQVQDFQSLFKDLQTQQIKMKFKQFDNIVKQQNQQGQLLIHQAIYEDNLQLVKYMAQNYPDQLNELTQNNERPYILAYKLKQYHIFDYLFSIPKLTRDQDYQIDEINKRQNIVEFGSNSLFEHAIKNQLDNMKRYFLWKIEANRIRLTEDELLEVSEFGNLDQVCYLVEYVLDDVNKVNSRGDSPLLLACSRGRFDIVEYLIRVGKADINHGNRRGDTALLIASDKAHFKIMKYIIEQTDVDPNQHNNLGDNALLISSQKGEMRTVMYLIEDALVKFNQTNKNGDSALLKAAYWNRMEVIRYLVEEKSVHLYQENNNGYNCLLIAAKWGFLELIQYLVEERNMRTDQQIKNGDNALIIAADKGHINIIKYLLERAQMDINYCNNNGDTAMLRAAYRGDLEMIKYLKELRKVDVNQKNYDGDTAYLIACKQGYMQIIRYLLEQQNVDQEQENIQGNSGFLIACKYGHIDIIRYLFQARQVNVNKRNKNKDTALLLACQEGKLDIIEYLILEANVDVKAKNNNDEDVEMFAQKWGYSHLLRKRQSLLYLKEL